MIKFLKKVWNLFKLKKEHNGDAMYSIIEEMFNDTR